MNPLKQFKSGPFHFLFPAHRSSKNMEDLVTWLGHLLKCLFKEGWYLNSWKCHRVGRGTASLWPTCCCCMLSVEVYQLDGLTRGRFPCLMPLSQPAAQDAKVSSAWETTQDVPQGDASSRLAVMGCDWDHVSAGDLMAGGPSGGSATWCFWVSLKIDGTGSGGGSSIYWGHLIFQKATYVGKSKVSRPEIK